MLIAARYCRRQLAGRVGGTCVVGLGSHLGLNSVEGRREVVGRNLLLLGVVGSRGSRQSPEVEEMLPD